ELEDVPDVLSEGRRLNPFSLRHVCNVAESDLLDLVGELLPFHLVSCAHPVGDEFFEVRDVRPAEPSARTCARYAKVDSGISDIRGRPPRMKQAPPALVRRVLARPHYQARCPIHRFKDDLEADRLQTLARDDRCRVEERNVGDVEHHDRLAIVARLLHKLPRPCEVVLYDWLGTDIRRVRAAAGKYRRAGPVIARLSDRPSKICLLVHHVDQRLARLPVVEWRMQADRSEPAVRPEGIDEESL